jgi:hypothetical protein
VELFAILNTYLILSNVHNGEIIITPFAMARKRDTDIAMPWDWLSKVR